MEGRERKPTARSGVTRTAGCGSQAPEMEAKLLSAEANCRQMATEMLAKSEAEGKVVPMKEAVDCSQNNKGIKEATIVKDVQTSEMEGGYVMCEIGGEQQPVRFKAPPQKKKSGDTCRASGKRRTTCRDCKGLGNLTKKKLRNSALSQAQRAAMGLTHVRQQMWRKGRQVLPTGGCCNSHGQPVQTVLQ